MSALLLDMSFIIAPKAPGRRYNDYARAIWDNNRERYVHSCGKEVAPINMVEDHLYMLITGSLYFRHKNKIWNVVFTTNDEELTFHDYISQGLNPYDAANLLIV